MSWKSSTTFFQYQQMNSILELVNEFKSKNGDFNTYYANIIEILFKEKESSNELKIPIKIIKKMSKIILKLGNIDYSREESLKQNNKISSINKHLKEQNKMQGLEMEELKKKLEASQNDLNLKNQQCLKFQKKLHQYETMQNLSSSFNVFRKNSTDSADNSTLKEEARSFSRDYEFNEGIISSQSKNNISKINKKREIILNETTQLKEGLVSMSKSHLSINNDLSVLRNDMLLNSETIILIFSYITDYQYQIRKLLYEINLKETQNKRQIDSYKIKIKKLKDQNDKLKELNSSNEKKLYIDQFKIKELEVAMDLMINGDVDRLPPFLTKLNQIIEKNKNKFSNLQKRYNI